MNIWIVVTNSGAGNFMYLSENIHLLYTERTVAKENLMVPSVHSSMNEHELKGTGHLPRRDEQGVNEGISPPETFLFCNRGIMCEVVYG